MVPKAHQAGSGSTMVSGDRRREGVSGFSAPSHPVAQPAQGFQQAVAFHQHGQLDDAERLYRAVLQVDANNFGALHNLAALNIQRGRPEEAAASLRRALALQPNSTMAHISLGNALQAMSRFDEAIASFERAL